MDDTELEDGEACLYQENDVTNAIDPDVALSYIDEKIQNVLGHFQKDFEGVVSVETLGAKYGIYGSFLPTYRRSPVLSHSKTPPRVHNHVASQSPSAVRVEGGHPNSLPQANAPPSVRHDYGSSTAHKHASQNDLCRQTTRTQLMQSVKESTPKSEDSDPKTLKVRIKVGSDNLSGKKSASISCGLGLDGSPSSLEDDPVESRVLSHRNGMPSEAHESPTHILQIMTSFPVYGDCLLSPLPCDLIDLSGRPKVLQGILAQTSSRANQRNFATGHPKDRNASSGVDFLLKESDIDAVSSEKLISDALKLPLLSCEDSTFGESDKASMKEKGYSEMTKTELLESTSGDISLNDKPNQKIVSVGNVVGNETAYASSEMISSSGKIGNSRGEAAQRTTNTDTVGLVKPKKTSKNELKESQKQKDKKSLSCEGGNSQSSIGHKKKSKKSKVHGFTPENKATETGGRTLDLKDGNCVSDENKSCRSVSKDSSMQKKSSKGMDKYKEFFGELDEQEADLMDSSDVPFEDGLKKSQVVSEATLFRENILRERTSSSDINREAEARIDLKGFSPNIGLSSAATHARETWVCCDNCQKRRLLPPGIKLKSLPKKWICSMMTWLPDMSNCSISGEATTKAVRARYQLFPENSDSTHAPVERVHTVAATADIPDPVSPKDEKFIDKQRKASKLSSQKSPNQLLGSMKKKQQSTKDRIALDVKGSPLINDPEFDQLTKSDDTSVETKQLDRRGRQKADFDSDGGHAKMSITTSKREPGQDYPRISKRSKTRSTQAGDNDSATALDQGNEILGVGVDYDFANNAVRNEQITNSPNTNGRSTCQAAITLQESKFGGSSVAPSKRKADDFQDPPSSTPSSDTFVSDKEDFSKKKHRASKSKGKEHSARNRKADKRVKSVLQSSLDNTKSLQKDFSSAHPGLAATSSTSKVSGSFKSKACVQELKGSPVESVSSSPVRIPNSGKLTTGSKHILEKGNVHDVVKLDIGSPRKHSDHAYEGGTARSGHSRRDVKSSLVDLQEKSNGCLQSGLANISASKVHHNGCAANLGYDDGDCSEKTAKDSLEMHKYDSGKSEVKIPAFCGNSRDQGPVCEKKESATILKNEEKCESNVAKTEKDIKTHKSEPSTLKSKAHLDSDEMRSSAKFDAEKKVNHLASTSKRETFKCSTSSDGEKNKKSNCSQRYQANGMSSSSTDASPSNLAKELKPNGKTDSQNGSHHTTSKYAISNGHRLKTQDSSSPLRRVASNEAARNALKEARNLKHIADRLKKSNGTSESTKFYFEAALKFLHGASLLESGKTEDVRHADVAESVEIYSSTAKLCEFCAHEYERSKDMATAALAYKCMEVAYLRVIRISHQSASKDRHELQTVLQIVPSGESPSSSASDIDNLNNSVIGDKASHIRNRDSPQLAADLVITTRNCPNFERLLSFAQNVNLAMEASRRSRIAFTAASVSLEKLDSKEGITSVKRALDFNFHNVDGLLRLVRLAKDMISG